MASKTQAQRIEVLEQQMTELLVGQMQTEARIDAKFESLGEMLRTQIASAFQEHQVGTSGKELSDPTMFVENQLRRIESPEQQVSMWRVEQVAFEVQLESKLESFRSILRSQLLTALKEPKAEILGKTGMELGVSDTDMRADYEQVRDAPRESKDEREERLKWEKIREERRKERERDKRLEAKYTALGKKSKITRDKGLFTSQSTLSTLYRPKKDADDEMYGAADEEMEKLMKTDRFKADKQFAGTSERTGPRDRPVEFEKDQPPEENPFGLDQFLTEVKTDKKAMDKVGSEGHSIAYTVGILVDEAKWEFLDDLKARSPD